MPDNDGPERTPVAGKPAKLTQQEREAQALRANLRRRKQQANLRDEARQDEAGARPDGPADETTGG